MSQPQKVVVLNGGSGSFALLSSLKTHVPYITSIVAMADDGGSNAVMRDDLHILPPSDVRQSLAALTDDEELKKAMMYRFDESFLRGHTFGNVLLATLTRTTGNFSSAIDIVRKMLGIAHGVVPVTLDDVRLRMVWPDGAEMNGEHIIDDATELAGNPQQAMLQLSPRAMLNPAADIAIQEADLIIFGSGDMYTSLGTILAVDGMSEALKNALAKKIYLCNLVTKPGHTTGLTVEDHVSEVIRLSGGVQLDGVVYNTGQPDEQTLEKYRAIQSELVTYNEDSLKTQTYASHGADILAEKSIANASDRDVAGIKRTNIRHNGKFASKAVLTLYEEITQ